MPRSRHGARAASRARPGGRDGAAGRKQRRYQRGVRVGSSISARVRAPPAAQDGPKRIREALEAHIWPDHTRKQVQAPGAGRTAAESGGAPPAIPEEAEAKAPAEQPGAGLCGCPRAGSQAVMHCAWQRGVSDRALLPLPPRAAAPAPRDPRGDDALLARCGACATIPEPACHVGSSLIPIVPRRWRRATTTTSTT